MSSMIQFRGVKAILDAYELKGVECWAVFQGKELCHKGEGADELRRYLEMVKAGGTEGTMLLKVYEDVDNPKQIKANTPADGTIGFCVADSYGGPGTNTAWYLEKLKMEAEIRELKEGEKEDKTIGGKIGNALLGLLDEPNELVQLIGSLRDLFRGPGTVAAPAIGYVNTFAPQPVFAEPVSTMPTNNVTTNNSSMTEEERLRRLSASLDTLEKNDAKVIEHLEKLAKISVDNPSQFKMLLMMLDNS